MRLYGLSGIYSIRHVATNRRYIGSSKDIGRRWQLHLSRARRGSMTCISRALRELGAREFEFRIIELCPISTLLIKEKQWISFYNSASIYGFNTLENPTASYGRKHSDASRARMSVARRKRAPCSVETKAKMSATRKGVRFSEKAKANMSLAQKGRVISLEHRIKLSLAAHKRYTIPKT